MRIENTAQYVKAWKLIDELNERSEPATTLEIVQAFSEGVETPVSFSPGDVEHILNNLIAIFGEKGVEVYARLIGEGVITLEFI